MSWTQGVQTRETLPERFVEWADSQVDDGSQLACIVWDTSEPDRLHLDYYKDGHFTSSRTYRVKEPLGSETPYKRR